MQSSSPTTGPVRSSEYSNAIAFTGNERHEHWACPESFERSLGEQIHVGVMINDGVVNDGYKLTLELLPDCSLIGLKITPVGRELFVCVDVEVGAFALLTRSDKSSG